MCDRLGPLGVAAALDDFNINPNVFYVFLCITKKYGSRKQKPLDEEYIYVRSSTLIPVVIKCQSLKNLIIYTEELSGLFFYFFLKHKSCILLIGLCGSMHFKRGISSS